MTVTYYLRDDLKWADGEPFTAEDVVYTKYLAGDLGLSAICGASLALVTSVDAVDEDALPQPASITVDKASAINVDKNLFI